MDECINEHLAVSAVRQVVRGQPYKKQRTEEPMVPVTYAALHKERSHEDKSKFIEALLDSGSTATIINKEFVKKLTLRQSNSTEWNTAAGTFTTTHVCDMKLTLPEFSMTRTVHATVHVTDQVMTRDLIIGRELLNDLGIDIKFSTNTIQWGDLEIPMKPKDISPMTHFAVEDSHYPRSTILDAKYEKADLVKIVEDTKGIKPIQKRKLLKLLRNFEEMFDGTLGTWKNSEYHIELRKDAKPYHGKPYTVPKAYEQVLRREVERLVSVGVLRKINRSEWAAPTFAIPKKNGTIRFITDFRELNKRILRKPFPLPKIQDMLLKLTGFQYASALDLNMGYYHIKLDPHSRRLCTIVLPWGKYEYLALPQGLCNSPDVFQEKMSDLMEGLEFVRTYIDDLLVLTTGSFEDHLQKLDTVMQRLRDAGLKVNADKSFFCQGEIEYLGYWITRDGISPLPKKVGAIQRLARPKTKRELRSFLGLINYYRDMWIRRSDVLAPLTRMTSAKSTFKWTKEAEQAFHTIKQIVSQHVLLSHPDFSKPFEIHTDASKYQLGAVISQEGKPLAFYSRKLNSAQLNYTTTERELLAIIETLKEFRNLLLGQRIVVYTDHKNLTYKVFNTERVMRWRLIAEEYGAELNYVKGSHNVVADTLSRLELEPSMTSECQADISDEPEGRPLSESFAVAKIPINESFPLTFKQISISQKADAALMTKLRDHPAYTVRIFRGGGKERRLIIKNDKIVVPAELQQRIVSWYHETLCHPGETRTEATISQHFTFKGLRNEVHKQCATCDICQRTKRTKKKYGHLPPKEAEVNPWETLCVDMIGPYQITNKQTKNTAQLWCVTMIDPATGWFEIKDVPGTKRADVIANIVEQAWLVRYPWPQTVIMDRGKEFLAEFATMITEDYGVKRKPITKRNPQANAIVERVHQTIGNMIRTMRVHTREDLDVKEPWNGILAAIAFAVRATVHTTTQATPMQLVYGRDAIFNIPFQANWEHIRQRKQALINKNNKRENAKRISHKYRAGDRVMIKQDQNTKYGSDPYSGPYTVVQVNNNGTVRVRENNTTDTYNIRMLVPYRS